MDSQSQTNAVQNVLDESVKAEDVVHEDEVRYATAEDLQNEKLQKESEDNKQALEIEGKRIALDVLKGATEELERTSPKDPHARQYKNSAVMPKVSFAKPSTQGGGLKKLFLFLIACCAVGIFFGVEANSYYNYKDGKTNGVMSCTFSWLTVENLPISVTPLDTATFFGAFAIGAGILGVIGLFIWLDSDAKKNLVLDMSMVLLTLVLQGTLRCTRISSWKIKRKEDKFWQKVKYKTALISTTICCLAYTKANIWGCR